MARALKLGELPKSLRAKLSPKQKERLSKEQKAALKALRDQQANERRIAFYRVLASARIAQPVPEWAFHDERKWKFDYAWIGAKVALEVEGGVWTGGRHTRGKGFLADVEKYNAAALLGWRVLRCTPDTLTSRNTQEMLRRALKDLLANPL
jgi:hypothetical protein